MAKKEKQAHPCAGCVWGSIVCDRVYCPFPFCVRDKPSDTRGQSPYKSTDQKKEG